MFCKMVVIIERRYVATDAQCATYSINLVIINSNGDPTVEENSNKYYVLSAYNGQVL